MKKLYIFLFCIGFVLSLQGQIKYVFFFIGDGMGMTQVNATEMYKAELDNRIGISPLLFTQFPIASFATTFSSSHGVTDSAAGGTALATGSKTKNGAIGVDSTLSNHLVSVAEKMKMKGYKVGIVTNVSVDHATPASFYAHQENRNMGYEISLDLLKSGFDFFGGSGFSKPDTRYDGSNAPNIFHLIRETGYSIVYGYDAYRSLREDQDKLILLNKGEKSNNSIPYTIDQKEDDLTLPQMTICALDFLSKDTDYGFFLAIESGQIDWACHANDGATTIHEIMDLDEAVNVAYEFYLKHPDETLIIVTADHETGGAVLGTGSSRINLKVLQHQKLSQSKLSSSINELRKKNNGHVPWEEVKELLGDKLGLWKKIQLNQEQEKAIYFAYEQSFLKSDNRPEKSLYQLDEKIATSAIKVLNQTACLGWTSGSHSAGYVPVFAIGLGAELFKSKMDNTMITEKLMQIIDLYSVKKSDHIPINH